MPPFFDHRTKAFVAAVFMAIILGADTPAANRLVNAQSPYLQQHANNPVAWYPWGNEAFEKAQRENKMVFLSIGYSTCHWCHVMNRESFSDPDIAAYLNENFVSIKVDREERPDIDQVYMTFVQQLTGSGGWPLNVWLTPDRKPIFGGTYFPPDRRRANARATFPEVLNRIQTMWTEDREGVLNRGNEIVSILNQFSAPKSSGQLHQSASLQRRQETAVATLSRRTLKRGSIHGRLRFSNSRPDRPLRSVPRT